MMFNKIVTRNILADNIANMYFEDRIPYVEYYTHSSADCSLVSTARALLHSKMKENDKLMIMHRDYQGCRPSKHDVENLVRNDECVCSEVEKTSSVFHFITCNTESLSVFEEFLLEDGFMEIQKARLFFAKNFKCYLFVNTEKRISFFVMEYQRSRDVLIRYYHLAQCILLNAFPWYFNPETDKDKMLPNDIKLIQAIAEGDFDSYMSLLESYADEFEFRKEAINMQLDKFEVSLNAGRESSYQRLINNARSRIETLLAEIERYTREERDAMCMIEGIRAGIRESDTHRLKNLFSEYDALRFITNNGDDSIVFAVDTHLDNWNETAKDYAIRNKDSLIYRYVSSEYHEDIEKLFNEIFNKRTISILMTGLFRMYSNARIEGEESHMEYIKQDYSPNPHIYYYRCLGGFNEDIAEAINKQDFEFAIEIAMQSAGSINFEDSAVMENWIRWMFINRCNYRKCFELPDGSHVSLDGALAWIDEQKGEENE